MKQTIITLEGKKIKRTIQHVGQGFNSHVIYKGKRYDVECIENDIETGYGVWKCKQPRKEVGYEL